MINLDNIAKHNYKAVEKALGEQNTRLIFGDWTTFRRDNLSVSDALKGVAEIDTMSKRYESTIIGN